MGNWFTVEGRGEGCAFLFQVERMKRRPTKAQLRKRGVWIIRRRAALLKQLIAITAQLK